MITSVTLTNFKKYSNKTILLKDGITLLVGGNNEGKSTLLHALAVWEFCKSYMLHTKGKEYLCTCQGRQGVGMGIEDFSPVNIPELKYLWTNLKPNSGYNLKIRCDWVSNNQQNCYLEIGLALANERLFIKTTDTNLTMDSIIPNIAYLPPFAGISDKERRYYPAERKRLIGQSLAGAVLRNTIIDMYMRNQEQRKILKGDGSKIKSNDLTNLRATDPFEQLNTVLFEVFNCQLVPAEFDISFHNYVKVEMVKGNMIHKRFTASPDYKKRDIMTEGSGFLQWLSVYTFALDPDVNILLLDEPDAHLHCSLQTTLMQRLISIAQNNSKQILVATHSVEIVKSTPFEFIMNINGGKCNYLQSPSTKMPLLSGLGSEYSPLLNDAQRTKRLLIVENESDANFLKIFSEKLGIVWPNNLTVWSTTFSQKERKNVMSTLYEQINGIVSISLIDRDSSNYNTTEKTLLDKGFDDDHKHPYIRFRKWRRSEIENYLLCKPVMARLINNEQETTDFFTNQGLVFPNDVNLFLQSDMDDSTRPLFELSGKEYIERFCNGRGFNKFDLAKNFRPDEICDDIKTLINEIVAMCNLVVH
jgi:AAA15 family ATPase/GTPase